MPTILKLTASEKSFVEALERASGALGKFTADMNAKVAKGFKEADRQTTQFNRGLGRLSNTLKSFAVGGFFGITVPLGLAAKFGSDAYAEYDSLKRSLSSLDPTIGGVTKRLGELQELARLPSLGFQEAIKADVRLRSVGIGVEKSTKILKEFSNAIAQTGGGQAQFNEVTFQLGQMAAKGKVLSQDLRPIIEAAPAISQALQELFGTTASDDISNQLEKVGKNSVDFIDMLLAEMEKAPRVTGGWRTALENLTDTMFRVSAKTTEIADKLFGLSEGVNNIEGAIGALFEGFEQLDPSMQKIILGLTGLIAVLPIVAFGVAKLIDAWVFMSRTLLTTTGVIGIVVVALTTLAGLYLSHQGHLNKLATATQSLTEVRRQAAVQAGEEVTKLDSLITSLGKAKRGTDEYKNVKNRILAIAPQFKQYLTGTKDDLDGLALAAKAYANNLVLVAEANILVTKIADNKRQIEEAKKAPLALVDTWDDATVAVGVYIDRAKQLVGLGSGSKLGIEATVGAEGMLTAKYRMDDLVKSTKEYEVQLEKISKKIITPAVKPPRSVINKPLDDDASKAAEKEAKIAAKSAADIESNRIKYQTGINKTAEELLVLADAARAVKDEVGAALAEAGYDLILDDKIAYTADYLDSIKDMVKSQTDSVIEGHKAEEEALIEHNKKVIAFAEARAKRIAEADATKKKSQDDYLTQLKEEQEQILGTAVANVTAGAISGLVNEEANGFQKALKSQLNALGNYAIQLALRSEKIMKLKAALLAKPGIGTSIALLAGGIALKAAAASIQVNKLARGGVTDSPIFTILGDNPSGKEMALPFERNREFARDIAGYLGNRGGDSGAYEFQTTQKIRAEYIELITTRRKKQT